MQKTSHYIFYILLLNSYFPFRIQSNNPLSVVFTMSYKKTIFTGTLILTLSGFLARILGFYNRIFLSNLIGAKELGIYQLIFPIYMLCFSLCCHGFETGISNLTSRFFAKGQKKNAHHLVRLPFPFFFPFSLSFFLFFSLFY